MVLGFLSQQPSLCILIPKHFLQTLEVYNIRHKHCSNGISERTVTLIAPEFSF